MPIVHGRQFLGWVTALGPRLLPLLASVAFAAPLVVPHSARAQHEHCKTTAYGPIVATDAPVPPLPEDYAQGQNDKFGIPVKFSDPPASGIANCVYETSGVTVVEFTMTFTGTMTWDELRVGYPDRGQVSINGPHIFTSGTPKAINITTTHPAAGSAVIVRGSAPWGFPIGLAGDNNDFLLDGAVLKLSGTHYYQMVEMATSGSEPPYLPSQWIYDGNKLHLHTAATQLKNNCYNYGCNKKNPKARISAQKDGAGAPAALPGRAGKDPISQLVTCQELKDAAIADKFGPDVNCDNKCPNGKYKKMAFAGDITCKGNGKKIHGDFHWYRQDSDGRWSHKAGQNRPSMVDSDLKIILDPRNAARKKTSMMKASATVAATCGVAVNSIVEIEVDYKNCALCFCCNPSVAIKE